MKLRDGLNLLICAYGRCYLNVLRKNKDWESVQKFYEGILGEEGVQLRLKYYTPFFLKIGINVRISENCRFYKPEHIILEDNTRINIECLVYGSGGVKIGRNVLIGPRFFLHSANHSFLNELMTQLEQGYQYLPVEIQENCLISANVSVMPGANIAAGSFVAAGSVVTKGTYPENARLMGVPAQASKINDKTSSYERNIVVGFYLPSASMQHPLYATTFSLIERMGYPQVSIVDLGRLPLSLKILVLFDEREFLEEKVLSKLADRNIEIWTMARGNHRDLKDSALLLQNGCSRKLPSGIQHIWRPSNSTQEATLNEVMSVTLYYASKRLEKNSEISDSLLVEWALLLCVLPSSISLSNYISMLQNKASLSLEDIDFKARLWRDRQVFSNLSKLVNSLVASPEKLSFSILHKNPLICIHQSFMDEDGRSQNFLESLSQSISKTKIVNHLAIFGISAYLCNDKELVSLARKRITTEFESEKSALYRSAINSSGYCYEPALITFLLLMSSMDGLEPELTLGKEDEIELIWDLFSDSSKELERFIDFKHKKISKSLITNLKALTTLPYSESNQQYELGENCYKNNIHVVDDIWSDIIKSLFENLNAPLIKIKPWPHSYKAALSLRYDVDRPLTSLQLRSIIEIQKVVFNSACASWYFFKSDESELKRYLRSNHQEIGIHSLSSSMESVLDLGVTFHSGPEAGYWKGVSSIESVLVSGGAYTESLSCHYHYPHSMAIGSGERIWLTPLHYPLEGSSSTKDLEYFDKLYDEFKLTYQYGGHLILASHPDIPQDHLVKLIRREELSSIWFETISNVLSRYRRLKFPGAVQVLYCESAGYSLCSDSTISDVAVEVYLPDGAPVFPGPLQLNPHVPRLVTYEDVS